MGEYEVYLGRLKQEGGGLDAGRMRKGIDSRMRSRSRSRLIGGGLLAIFLFASLAYALSGLYPQNSELLADYVIERESSNGDAIMNYVLTD